MERSPAPNRLRQRLHQGDVRPKRFEYPLLATAAVVLFLLIPLVADVSVPRLTPEAPNEASLSPGGITLAALSDRASSYGRNQNLVSRRMTGTLVCLDCEARLEAGLCPLPESHHVPAFCADNGEVWRLMSRDPALTSKSAGQTLTVEGIGFPQSGFLRASRVGY